MSKLTQWSLVSVSLTFVFFLVMFNRFDLGFKPNQEPTFLYRMTQVSVTPQKTNSSTPKAPEKNLSPIIPKVSYPRQALIMNQKGTSEIELILKKDLSLSLRLSRSSGSSELDEASLNALKSIPRDELKEYVKNTGTSHHKVQFNFEPSP